MICFDESAAYCGGFRLGSGPELLAVPMVYSDIIQGVRIMGTLLLIILVLLVIGALPTWGYSRGWGYFPSGGLGLVLLILLILVLMGRI